MVLGGLARKRRKLDEHEREEPTEVKEATDYDSGSKRHRSRPRTASHIKKATLVEELEPIPTFSTSRTNSDSEARTQSSGETIGAPPQQFFRSENLLGYNGLSQDQNVHSIPHPPLSGYDLDRLNYHIDLQDFGTDLQKAADAVFSGDRRSRYTHVTALLLSWKDEDPQLPVSLEIKELKTVLVGLYGFEVEEWLIPPVNSHGALNLKILNFLEDSGAKNLKLVYYAGHGKLSNHGQAIWSSHRNQGRERPPTVKWSGIQNALEESPSDVLILLDCCASGLSNTDEGNGVTELLAACAFNGIANGVGPYSFTHALISQLRKLAHLPFFTVGYLYNLLFTKIQSLEIDDVSRKKPPIHLVLTQDHRLPRSIRISARRLSPRLNRPPNTLIPERMPISDKERNFDPGFVEQDTQSSQSSQMSSGVFSPDSDGESSSSSITQIPEYPRILLSIRISESIKPSELSPELFADWLGTIPLFTRSVRVEAGFASDSTLVMVSVPIALLAYLPKNPAIMMLGVTRSTNLLSTVEDRRPTLPSISELRDDDVVEDRQQDTQDSGFEDMSMSYDDKMESPKAWRDTPMMNFAPPGRCHSCNRTETPQRRPDPDGLRTLCNICGLEYQKSSYSKYGQKQTPKSGSSLCQSISLPTEELNSPSVRNNLFRDSSLQSPELLDTLSVLKTETEEKERLIRNLREDLDDAKAPPKHFKAESSEACHDRLATLATSSNNSSRLLHTGDSRESPITPPISATLDSNRATRRSHLDLPKIVVISDENVCREAVFALTPVSSETNVSDRNGLFKSGEITVLHAKTPVSPSNDQSSPGQEDSFIAVADPHKHQNPSLSAFSSGSDWLPPSWDSGTGDDLHIEQPVPPQNPE